MNNCIHSVRKQSPLLKYSFCLPKRRFGCLHECHLFGIYGRIVRIFLSIRTLPNAPFLKCNLCLWIQKYRFRPCCISSTNQNLVALRALAPTFLLERSWMSPLRVVGVFASGEQAPSVVHGDSSYSRLSFGDLLRQATQSSWWNVQRTGC